MGIPYQVLDADEATALQQTRATVQTMQQTGLTHALVVEKNTFAPYSALSVTDNGFPLTREEAIQTVVAATRKNDIIVSTTGMISRELFEYRTAIHQSHSHDFLTVGSMGHASQIALGIAMEKVNRQVWCFDGDGASIMHMGNMAIVGSVRPSNLIHVVFNNGAHDSVGGQPTVGLQIDLPKIAAAMGYQQVYSAKTLPSLQEILEKANRCDGPVFVEVCVRKGHRPDLGRPTTTPAENKEAFMDFLK